ncbi:MAG: ABC transporter permease [Spirochaetia bacterium]|nr:ABC transporter permease [Spirochaetia bacterium]
MNSVSPMALDDRNRKMRSLLHTREVSLLIVILIVIVVLSLLKPEAFLSRKNFEAMFNGMVFDLFTAAGLTLALILWGIDLSVGSVLALTSVITGMALRAGVNIPFSIALGLMTSVICGALNGFFIARFKIAPFIVTLAMYSVARGAAVVLTSGYYLSGLPEAFVAIGRGSVFSVPIPIFFAVIVLVLLGIMMKKHNFFHQMYFVGNNPEASELSGINTRAVIMTGYILSSLLAGISAIFMTSRLAMGFSGFGLLAEQRAIAAAVIGGASFSGGEGSIQGAVLGVFLLALINNGFVLLNGSPNWQQAVSGIILLVAVGVDAYRRRKGRRD